MWQTAKPQRHLKNVSGNVSKYMVFDTKYSHPMAKHKTNVISALKVTHTNTTIRRLHHVQRQIK